MRRIPLGVAALALVATVLSGGPASGAPRTLTFGAVVHVTFSAQVCEATRYTVPATGDGFVT